MSETKELTKPSTIQAKEAKEPVSELSKITGKFLIKNNRKTWLSSMSGNPDGRSLHVGTFTMFTPELDSINKGAVRTGIYNDTLRKELEEALMVPAGTLKDFNREWWSKYFIKIPSNGYIIDCDANITNKLNYLILRASSKFYSDGINGAKNKSTAHWIITSTEAEKSKESRELEVLTQAYAKLSEMSPEERLNFLKVYEEGKYKVSNSSKPDFINAAIKLVIEESPAKFIQTFSNPYYNESVFLQDALAAKAVYKQGPRYIVTSSGEILGKSYMDTLNNLQSAEWQSVKISLLDKIQATR